MLGQINVDGKWTARDWETIFGAVSWLYETAMRVDRVHPLYLDGWYPYWRGPERRQPTLLSTEQLAVSEIRFGSPGLARFTGVKSWLVRTFRFLRNIVHWEATDKRIHAEAHLLEAQAKLTSAQAEDVRAETRAKEDRRLEARIQFEREFFEVRGQLFPHSGIHSLYEQLAPLVEDGRITDVHLLEGLNAVDSVNADEDNADEDNADD